MIGGDQRCPAAMPVKAFQTECLIEVDVVEREDRKTSRERAISAEVSSHVGFVEVRRHSRSPGTAQPFIEVAQNNARALQLLIRDDSALDQLPCLLPLFEETRAEMHVKYVEDVLIEPDVGPQATASLAAAGAD